MQAVGGVAHPHWPTWPSGGRRPRLLPGAGRTTGDATGELDWVVGCTYTGQPTAQAEVRNLMGCNMSFRREVFERVGGFAEDIGRIGQATRWAARRRSSASGPGRPIARAGEKIRIVFEPRRRRSTTG